MSNEHTFVRALHRRLPRSQIYAWKINDKYQGGVPDAMYMGDGGLLWVEYKYIKAYPKRGKTVMKLGLSENQKIWLRRAYDNGQQVAVVVGCEKDAVILDHPGAWRDMPAEEFAAKARPYEEVMDFIKWKVLKDERCNKQKE
jgi:hypothetical protein